MILKESTLIVTGASGNIGFHLTNYLASRAYKVIAVDIVFDDKQEFNENVELHQVDVTSESSIQHFFQKIDIGEVTYLGLVNGAGVIFNRPLVNLLDKKSPIHSADEFNRVLHLNLTGSFLMGGNFANYCIKSKKKGCIINVSSVTASGNLGQTAYSASKAGVEAMARVWAKELGMFKIRAASIAPGFFNTDSTHKSLSEPIINKYKSAIPLKRFGELNDLAHAVEFILTNNYFNGEVLAINGGYRV